jgi:hypothetical protein
VKWSKAPTEPKSELLRQLSPQELFISITKAMDADVEWAQNHESIIS